MKQTLKIMAVSESAPPDPGNPHAALMEGGAPRLLVLGDATFTSNEAIGGLRSSA